MKCSARNEFTSDERLLSTNPKDSRRWPEWGESPHVLARISSTTSYWAIALNMSMAGKAPPSAYGDWKRAAEICLHGSYGSPLRRACAGSPLVSSFPQEFHNWTDWENPSSWSQTCRFLAYSLRMGKQRLPNHDCDARSSPGGFLRVSISLLLAHAKTLS